MFGNIGKMMKLASEMKTRLPEMKAKLESSLYTCQAGGQAVSATVNGKMMLTELKIDPKILEDNDVEMLEDLVKAAVSAAQAKAAEAAAEAMKELTGGMELPPGMGL